MARKLASVQIITGKRPIEGADRIETVNVLGWHVVTQKETYKIGDKVVYFEVDSCVPKEKSLYPDLEVNNYRVKTMKFRGQVSQGFIKKLDELGLSPEIEVGTDVTELLGVKKYELPDEYVNSGIVTGYLPGYVHSSSETRIQTIPELLDKYKGTRCWITEKMDGTSASFSLRDNDYKVCSHDKEVSKELDSCYAYINKTLNMEDKVKSLHRNLAIQGEICGPTICKNRYGFANYRFFVFDIFDADTYEHLPMSEVYDICKKLKLDTVPVITDNFILPASVDELVEASKGISKYNKVKREGIVIRSYDEIRNLDRKYDLSRLTFKVINPEYSLKRGN